MKNFLNWLKYWTSYIGPYIGIVFGVIVGYLILFITVESALLFLVKEAL